MNSDELAAAQDVEFWLRDQDEFDKANAIDRCIKEIEALESLLDEAIRALEQNHTSSHPSARALITTMSPAFRDFRGVRESENRKAKEPPVQKWRD